MTGAEPALYRQPRPLHRPDHAQHPAFEWWASFRRRVNRRGVPSRSARQVIDTVDLGEVIPSRRRTITSGSCWSTWLTGPAATEATVWR